MSQSHLDTLILPVETLNREFDAKLHLALRAAARGWKVILGGKAALNDSLPSLPRSIYLAKGIRTSGGRVLRLIGELGHVIVALDEESLIRQSDEALLMMLDEETFNRPKLLYAWGKSNADLWRRFKGYHGTPILEVGNPRIDLLRPELSGFYAPDKEAIRARFGRFVLISSNFSLVNHYIKNYVRFRTAKGSDSARRDELKSGIVGHKARLFDAFRAVVPQLAKAIAPVNLIIRPHPSENADTWRAVIAGTTNAHVLHEGPIAPWIMAAEALIHNGCTSGVEAAIVGTPAFAFRPYVSDQYDVALPNGLSRNCYSADELVQAVAASLASGGNTARNSLTDAQRALLKEHVTAADGPFSANLILDSLSDNRTLLESGPVPDLWRKFSGIAGHFGRQAVRAFTTRMPWSRSSAGYIAHKFPGMTDEMIAGRIERFRALIPSLPATRRRQIASNIFAIEKC